MYEHGQSQGPSGSQVGADGGVGIGPGKRTLTEQLPVMRKMEGVAAPAGTPGVAEADQAFATSFVACFRDVLDVFPAVAALAKAPGEPALTPAVASLSVAFSAWQRARLTEYMATKIIPDELFIAKQATGAATTPQKTTLAANILANGHTVGAQKGDSAGAPGKIKGSCCANWTELVWIYAGVQPAGGEPGGNEGTVGNSTGPTGEISFAGGGQRQNIAAQKPDPSAKGFFLGIGGPDPENQLAAVMKLQAGDWFWARTDHVEGHSLIFLKWDAVPTITGAGISARALAYSQRSNSANPEERKKVHAESGGGDLTSWPITPAHPVTMITRPPDDAGPPRTEAQLLHYDHAAANTLNQKDVDAQHWDIARYQQQMVAAARSKLGIASKIEQSQQDLCTTIMNDAGGTISIDNLSRLIALVQRLNLAPVLGTRTITGHLAPSEWSLIPGGLAAISHKP